MNELTKTDQKLGDQWFYYLYVFCYGTNTNYILVRIFFNLIISISQPYCLQKNIMDHISSSYQ